MDASFSGMKNKRLHGGPRGRHAELSVVACSQSDVACGCGDQLRLACRSRNEALHILLLGSKGDLDLQIRVSDVESIREMLRA